MSEDAVPTIRVDKWLWYARFLKSRSLASRFVSDGNLRIGGERSTKPSRGVKPGDVLTFVQATQTRVIKIVACGERRGPAPEAQALYEDLTPAPKERPTAAKGANPRYEKGGRPTKKDRRDMGLD